MAGSGRKRPRYGIKEKVSDFLKISKEVLKWAEETLS